MPIRLRANTAPSIGSGLLDLFFADYPDEAIILGSLF